MKNNSRLCSAHDDQLRGWTKFCFSSFVPIKKTKTKSTRKLPPQQSLNRDAVTVLVLRRASKRNCGFSLRGKSSVAVVVVGKMLKLDVVTPLPPSPPAKVVDLDSCLTKKPVEESACHPYNTRGSMSEVHSLSSFQSESCDDNGTLTVTRPARTSRRFLQEELTK